MCLLLSFCCVSIATKHSIRGMAALDVPKALVPSESRQSLLATLSKDLSEEVGKENDFVLDTISRFTKSAEFQDEIINKLYELLDKAEICRETAIGAIEALEKKLAPFLEAADRSNDIDPMQKFIQRAQGFTTSNYAFPSSNMAPRRQHIAALVSKTAALKADASTGLTSNETYAWNAQSATWADYMKYSLGKEGAISSNASVIIHQSFLKTQYHVWHVLPDFIPAMKARAKFLPSYAPLHKAVLVLAEHCRKEGLSLNQTLKVVKERKTRLKVRLEAFKDIYARAGGLTNGTALDVLMASKSSTDDLFFLSQTLFGSSPKVGFTSLSRAEAMLRYWLSQLTIRDPRTIPDNANHTGVERGPAAVDDTVAAGIAASRLAEVAAFGSVNASTASDLSSRLQTDTIGINRARKWVSYWKRVVVGLKAEEKAAREAIAKREAAEAAALEAATQPKAEGDAAASEAAAAVAAVAAAQNTTKAPGGGLPITVSSRYMQFLADWEARLAASPDGSRAKAIAQDWVTFWREKLGIVKKEKTAAK